MGDDQIVISSGLVISPETVMNRSFTSAFRGYHPAEVHQFLKRVSDEMAASAGREVELRRALQEALARAAHPELDEATLTNILGEHAARLLASARDTAASITAEAQKQADAMVRDAESRVARMREEADGLMARRVAEADATAASIRHAAQTEAKALGDRARAEAQALIDAAARQGKDMVGEARSVRERMLGDLTRRRRSAQVQVEQLLAARDRLLAAHDVVRRTLEQATAELQAAEPEARNAAEAVGRRSHETVTAGELTADDMALLSEPLTDLAPPRSVTPAKPEPAGSMSPMAASPRPPVRDRRPTPAPTGAPSRRLQQPPPPLPERLLPERLLPERPPLRPQTVADAVAGRMATGAVPSAPAVSLAPTPPSPPAARPRPTPPLPPAAPPPEVETVETVKAPGGRSGEPDGPVVTVDAPANKVEELFARIRADREEPEADQAVSRPADDNGSSSLPQDPPRLDPVATESALESRDLLLDDVEAGLTRALKRVLQDEQNEVLDTLRRLGASAGDGVLPAADAQAAAYRDAARPWLHQAARAGAGFVSDAAPGSGAETDTPAIEAQAQALAVELAAPLRERLARAVAGGTEADDASVAAESLRAAYRQWKVQQVEECARHHAVAAFSVGAFAATADAAVLQWVAGDDGHCPDCDDNALAGSTPKGRPFPTGQLHPPAHPGCRCVVVVLGT